MQELVVGTPVEGTVKRVTAFGVFLDIGAERDALYPKDQVQGDMSAIKVGDTITGIRISMNDVQNMRLAVSSKKNASDFQEGDPVTGTVLKAMTFGVFVDVGASTDALVPAKWLDKDPSDYKPGEELTGLKVLSLDVAENRITLKETEEMSGAGSQYESKMADLRVGQKISGIVGNVRDFGVFVDIGLGRQDALLPASLLGTKNPEDFERGQKIEAFIIMANAEEGKVTLSMSEPEEGGSAEAAGQVEGLEWMPGGGPPAEIPVGTMLFDMDWAHAWRTPLRQYFGEEIMRLGFPSWKSIQEKCPDLFVLPEKEVDELLGGSAYRKAKSNGIPHDPTHYNKRPLEHFIPVPPHLRKAGAEIPDPESIPSQWKYVPGRGDPKPTYDTLIKPEIHTKYLPPPLNDPNFQWPYFDTYDDVFVKKPANWQHSRLKARLRQG